MCDSKHWASPLALPGIRRSCQRVAETAEPAFGHGTSGKQASEVGPIGAGFGTIIAQEGQRQFTVGEACNHQGPISRCETLVPSELDSVGLCVLHFTLNIEQNCAELHRQIALRGATQERQAAVAIYIRERASLLALIACNLCLSDDLKRRMLSTFLSLMNLRDRIAHPASYPEPRASRRSVVPAEAVAS